MTTIDKIVLIVEKYNGLPRDFSDVDRLTEYQRKLACVLFDYSGEVGDLYKLAIGTEFTRKAAFERKRLQLIGEGKTGVAAENEARASVEQAQFQEVAADGDYRSALLQLNAARDVLEAMKQQISSIKQEKRLEMSGAGSQT